ncbi:MAG: hypothetical protein OEW18_01945 [Candidatus Aminicenantes bacterium]|nr:hypothetical protein [Candidatus Aminicenantes bacterium]
MNNKDKEQMEKEAARSLQENLPGKISWKYYPEQQGKFLLECFHCQEKRCLNSDLFLAESSKPDEDVIFTRQHKIIDGWITRKLGTAVAFVMALAIGTSIARALGSPPLLYMILAGIFLIPLKPICSLLFSRIDPGIKIPIWRLKCQNCGSSMFVASDGSSARLGQAIDIHKT